VSSARDEFARPERNLYAATTRTAIFLATIFYANESALNDFNFFGINALTFPFLNRLSTAFAFHVCFIKDMLFFNDFKLDLFGRAVASLRLFRLLRFV